MRRTQRFGSGIVLGSIIGALTATAATTLTATQGSTVPQAINLPGRSVAAPFSDAVLAGNTLYLAGRLGLDPETQRPPGTAEQEARNVLNGIQAVLAEAEYNGWLTAGASGGEDPAGDAARALDVLRSIATG